MENVIVFAITFMLILSLGVFLLSSLFQGSASVLQALKTYSDRAMLRATGLDGLYITYEGNGVFYIKNDTARDLLYLRVFCWQEDNPSNAALLEASYNGVTYLSIPALSFLEGYDRADYNLLKYFSQTAVDGNLISCVMTTKYFIRGFEVPG
ncbi:MAG: hypothetical protein GXO00_00745 [Candidatus Diapherotrites archaeon]|nr:hypothetical protein [Candidatus Diapherotrites archaeon]